MRHTVKPYKMIQPSLAFIPRITVFPGTSTNFKILYESDRIFFLPTSKLQLSCTLLFETKMDFPDQVHWPCLQNNINLNIPQFLSFLCLSPILLPFPHTPSKIRERLGKTCAVQLAWGKKTDPLPPSYMHTASSVWERKISPGRFIFQKCPLQAKNHNSFKKYW